MKAEKKPNFGVWELTEANEPTKVATVTITDKGVAHIVQWIKDYAPTCMHKSCVEKVVDELTTKLQCYHVDGCGPRYYEFSGFYTDSGNPEWLELELSQGHYSVTFEEV
jgi:hypothetical protein